MTLRLHGYWRSTACYRVRIALALKGLDYEQTVYDLRRGAQRDADYLAVNPQGLVPALEADGIILTQSIAILEWLEERHPTPALLPPDPEGRAAVRAMAAAIACDIHPLNNLRVIGMIRDEFGADEAAVHRWMTRWMTEGFAALETLVVRLGGRYAYGDSPTLADCYLVPQVYSAERFGIDISAFPALIAAAERARALDAVAAAHPDRQPDAEPA